MQILLLYDVFKSITVVSLSALILMHYNATVKPPISDHPKCKELVVAYKTQTTGDLLLYILEILQ